MCLSVHDAQLKGVSLSCQLIGAAAPQRAARGIDLGDDQTLTEQVWLRKDMTLLI